MKRIFIAIFLLFFAYSLWFIYVHVKDYSHAYITIPYQIFTLIHFINFLRLDYDSDLYDLNRFSMYRVDISHSIPYLSAIKKRHFILPILTALLCICVTFGDASTLILPEVYEMRWMYMPFVVLMAVICIYGTVYYSFYKGIHLVIEADLLEHEHVYVMDGFKYSSSEFDKNYYNQ